MTPPEGAMAGRQSARLSLSRCRVFLGHGAAWRRCTRDSRHDGPRHWDILRAGP
jgi:hypothetical protein